MSMKLQDKKTDISSPTYKAKTSTPEPCLNHSLSDPETVLTTTLNSD